MLLAIVLVSATGIFILCRFEFTNWNKERVLLGAGWQIKSDFEDTLVFCTKDRQYRKNTDSEWLFLPQAYGFYSVDSASKTQAWKF
jgi:hypothetical protein